MGDPWMMCPYGCAYAIVEGIGRDRGRYHCRVCMRCVSLPTMAFAAFERGLKTGITAFNKALADDPASADSAKLDATEQKEGGG